ncbi:O-acetylhomoserine aminocarboxypropyltransferase/cysteine synthase family protein [Natranaerofaba carboxydovora]|uniref:O-acetylhomoserine aminocarboxypropyltransferase/cysteine synthase family protein n=1 Tax=Natranaerofaba carboxydovora TaxID=2742683 RepID=UPI001F137761|nr:O-acetylhomoserine aminocarboxypropyltransferase/cysteine synthase [Natranaerofaba carboxydovora]UMZ72615.1 L-methionine gamma-lyase [Natranaerofaba carboxydovora]
MVEFNESGFETRQLHAGHEPDKETASRAVPIYQTTSYVFESPEYAAKIFALEQEGYIYTRITNPTLEVLEKRLSSLEGGVGGLAVASGQAAITYSLLNIAGAGDEVISSSHLYGGTHTLFTNTLPKFGIKVKFLEDPNDTDEIKRLINDKTRAVFAETIGNPKGSILDIEKVAKTANDHGLPLIVDNTFATPYLCRPIDYGANVVIHSVTKFLGGHGTSIGGAIVDGGNFEWNKERFPEFNEPDPSYHGLVYNDIGEAAYITKARVQLLRDVGACMSPFNGFLILQGIETLSLRMERHVENSLEVARFLEEHSCVEWVEYAGLKSHKDHELSNKYLNKGPGAVFTFGIKGGSEAGEEVIKNVKVFSHLANVGDAKSLIIHPASTTHQQLSKEEQQKAGVLPELIRISVGLENVEDLKNDLDQALKKSCS